MLRVDVAIGLVKMVPDHRQRVNGLKFLTDDVDNVSNTSPMGDVGDFVAVDM